MDQTLDSRYWCHLCAIVVDPITDPEIKCPFCESGFVEEMNSADLESLSYRRSNRAVSQRNPNLLGLMGGSSTRSRDQTGEEDEGDREFNYLFRRRMRNFVLLRLLEGIRDEFRLNLDNFDGEIPRESDLEREREGRMLINSLGRSTILREPLESSANRDELNNASTFSSFEDYLFGLELLLRYLSENDPSRYGSPPAKKEAVDALPNVKVAENLSCSVCLDEFEVGSEAKEMPCKHKFHANCILPWLKLHSSCPVCRFQLPSDELKDLGESSTANRVENGDNDSGDLGSNRESNTDRGNTSRPWPPLPWPFNGLFSSWGSRESRDPSSNPSSSSSSTS
uniref:RING-type E3 ubiquitin transferase n=1 Tax=Ananas comosus var. bracteatus TaxID=296719 RepID=A0A6V7NTS3_ANACO|nr:unnamed protein product [Ananas comosus var. bracteatus]